MGGGSLLDARCDNVPMRIITHTCSNTEIVCALGRADWLVGVDDHSDFPPEVVRDLPRIGPDLDIDIERIAALKPDLIITSLTVPGHERCLEKIRAAGLPHLVTQPHSLADVARDIESIAEALDAREAGRALAERFEQTLNTDPPDHPRVPILVEWWPKPVIVPGERSWVNEMLRLAGGFNPWETHDAESLEVDAAEVGTAAPHGVVMSWCGVDESKYRPHVVKRRAGWENVPALVHDRIFPISEAWLGRPGPRLLEGIRKLEAVVEACRGSSVAGLR